jgi:hypothetical protein
MAAHRWLARLRVDAAAAQAVQSAERTACNGNAGRARTFQGCLLRNRSQARKTRRREPAGLVFVSIGGAAEAASARTEVGSA